MVLLDCRFVKGQLASLAWAFSGSYVNFIADQDVFHHNANIRPTATESVRE